MLKNLYIIFLIFFLFIGLFFNYSHRAKKRNYSDFRVYYSTSKHFLLKEDIYSRPDISITPFKYSPCFAFCFSWLGLFSIDTAAKIFFVINFLSIIFIFFILKKFIVKEPLSKKFLLYFLSSIFVFRFILQVLHSGQITIIMFLLSLLSLYFMDNKILLSAFFLSLSIMFKYTPIIFLVYFLFRKRIKFAIFVFLFLFLFSILPAIYVGIDKQVYYLKKWLPYIINTSLDKGSFFDIKNQSLYSFILRIKPINLNFEYAILFSILIVFFIFFFTIIKENKYIDYSVIFILMALLNPNAWLSNFSFLLFPYFFLTYYLIKTNFKDKITFILIIISFILSSFTSQDIVGNTLEDLFLKNSTITISSLILVLVLLRLKFKNVSISNNSSL